MARFHRRWFLALALVASACKPDAAPSPEADPGATTAPTTPQPTTGDETAPAAAPTGPLKLTAAGVDRLVVASTPCDQAALMKLFELDRLHDYKSGNVYRFSIDVRTYALGLECDGEAIRSVRITGEGPVDIEGLGRVELGKPLAARPKSATCSVDDDEHAGITRQLCHSTGALAYLVEGDTVEAAYWYPTGTDLSKEFGD